MPSGAGAPLRGGALFEVVVEAAPEALLGALTQDLSCAPLWLGHHRRRGNRAVICSPWEEGPASESLFSAGSPHGLALKHRRVEFTMTNSGTPLLRGEHQCFEEHYLLQACEERGCSTRGGNSPRGDLSDSGAPHYVLELQAQTPTAPYGGDCHARVRFEIRGLALSDGGVASPRGQRDAQQCSLRVTYEVLIRGGINSLTQGMIRRGMAAGLQDNYNRCFLPSLKEIFPVRDADEANPPGGVSKAFSLATTALLSPAASQIKRRESSAKEALEGVAPWLVTLARATYTSDEAGAVLASTLACYVAQALTSGFGDEVPFAGPLAGPVPSPSPLRPLAPMDFLLGISLYFCVLLAMRSLNYGSVAAILLDVPSVLVLRVQRLLGVLQAATAGAAKVDQLHRKWEHRRTHSTASSIDASGASMELSPGAYVPAAAEAALKAAAVASLAGLTPAEQAAAVSGIKDTAQQSIVTQYLQGQAVATLAGLGGERIAAEVFENERFQPFRGWGSTWPGHFLPTDGCGKWSTRDFQPKGPSNMVFELVAPPLPPGFDWLEESWYVDRSGVATGQTDADGWFYGGMVFHRLSHWPPDRGSGAVTGRTFVRRRRWIRTCVKVKRKTRVGEGVAEACGLAKPPGPSALDAALPPPPVDAVTPPNRGQPVLHAHSLPSKLSFDEDEALQEEKEGVSLTVRGWGESRRQKRWGTRRRRNRVSLEIAEAHQSGTSVSGTIKFSTGRTPGTQQQQAAATPEKLARSHEDDLCFQVFENERRDVQHTKWGKFRLPTDPHRWSNLSATLSQADFKDMEKGLPEPPRAGLMWKWQGDWEVDAGFTAYGETDSAGWVYAIDWRPWLISHEADSSHFPSGVAQCTAAHFVRRRRWVRKRVLVGAAPVGIAPADLAKEFLSGISEGSEEESIIGEIAEFIYENERRDVRFTSWGSLQKSSDPARWSDLLATASSPVFWDVVEEIPPPGYAWSDDAWLPDTRNSLAGHVDREGWCYAVDFFPWLISKSNEPLFPTGKPQPAVTSFVRRRRWIRRYAPMAEAPCVEASSASARLVVHVPSVLKDLTGPGRWPHKTSQPSPVQTLKRSVSSPELRRPSGQSTLPDTRGSPDHASDTEHEAPGGFLRSSKSCRIPDLREPGLWDRQVSRDSDIVQVRRIPTREYNEIIGLDE